MKNITQFINEAKSYFPKLNKNILGLFDKLSKEDKTGKQLIKFLYDELYTDINSVKLKDLKALFNGYEDKSFYVVYGNGNYGGQQDFGDLQTALFKDDGDWWSYTDNADYCKTFEDDDAGDFLMLRFTSGNNALFVLDNGDNGEAYICLTK